MITIDKITIAVADMEKMVRFYGRIFGVELQPTSMYNTTLYTGQLGKVELLFCPKEIAGVDAQVNTIQLRFVVENIKDVYNAAVELGATMLFELQEQDGRLHAAFRDPDGNSLEIVEARR